MDRVRVFKCLITIITMTAGEVKTTPSHLSVTVISDRKGVIVYKKNNQFTGVKEF